MPGRSVPSKNIEFRYNLKLYFSFVKKHKFAFTILIFAILISEIRNVVEKFLLKVIVDNGADFTAKTISSAAFIDILLIILYVYIGISILNVIVVFIRIHLLNRIVGRIIADMKRKFFKHILELDHNFHTTHKTGSLISRLTRGAGASERLMDIIVFNFAPLLLQVLVSGLVLIYFDIISAIIMMVTSIILVSYSFYIQRLQEPTSIIANKNEDIEKGNMADFYTNIDSIKYYGKEKTINNKFIDLSEDTRKGYLKNWDYFRMMGAGQTFILSSGTILLLYFTILKFLNGDLTLGTLTFIYTTFASLIGYMFMFVGGIRGFYRAMADFQDLFQYNKFSNEIKDKPNASNLIIKKGTVEFKNVDFSYGKRKIFDNFNLKIKENEKVALVGHSGSGKTTLIKLLNRFYDVDSGSVLIDGKNIKDFNQESVRGGTGIVPQEAILFDDTLYNNVKFANPYASRQEVLRAIRFAQLDKIIEKFTDKEKTIVGERGVRLSGGEKQRVSVARALLANKKILVLDEATSALDSETEHEIQKDLKNLLEGRTSIIIAHRLSTIMNADRIIVMKDGKIVQEGNHSELISQEGEYKKLWNLQKGGYIK